MDLFHLSPERNLRSILTDGILISKAQTVRKVVFLAERALVLHLFDHVSRRHGCTVHDVIAFRVSIARPQLVRFRPGIWFVPQDVPVTMLETVYNRASLMRAMNVRKSSRK